MAASTQCSYSTKSNTHRMEPTWATSLCRLYSPKGSWEALFNLPVFCPVEMTACFYTYWLENLHPHLTAVPTKPDSQTFTQNLGLPEEHKQNLSLYSDPAKGKVCRTTFNEMKETHFDERFWWKIQLHPMNPPYRCLQFICIWVHLRRTCSTDVTLLSTLSFSHSHPVLFVVLLLCHRW